MQRASEVAVKVVDLTKHFPLRRGWFRSGTRRVDAVQGVSFTLHKGEIFGLVGPNGAGKTTLIKMLTTLLEPSGGQAWVDGLDVVKDQHRVRRRIGLVTSNERSFYWRLTGHQNLMFFADLYRLPRRRAVEWIADLAEMLGLRDKIHQRFDGYSTGMRQRLALARGLLDRPQILFMDEPTKGVDPIGSAEIIRIIKQRIVPQWHPMILITSHNLSEIEKLCDRIAFMRHGRIVACGTMRELRRAATPLERYEMLVDGVTEAQARAIAIDAGGRNIGAADTASGLELRVEFAQGTEGFAQLTSALIRGGARLLGCTSHSATIDEVFDRLIAGEKPEAESRGGGDER